MVQKISREFLLKRAEHNEGDLETLEEITLHQFDLEKIELLDKFCPNLQIILLQNNVIGKIGMYVITHNCNLIDKPSCLENLNRLYKLTYINLALNNIQVIEVRMYFHTLCSIGFHSTSIFRVWIVWKN